MYWLESDSQKTFTPLTEGFYFGNMATEVTKILPLHFEAITAPQEVLRRVKEQINWTQLPIKFSESRGDLPVLTVSDQDVEQSSVYVVANSGAQLMNSLHYPYRRSHRESRDITDANEKAMGLGMLIYSREGDSFVFSSLNPEKGLKALAVIGNSLNGIGIQASRNFIPVESVDDWIQHNAGTISILPNVLEPELVSHYADGEGHELVQRVLAGVAVYTKNGAQQIWEQAGIPTPLTQYFDLSQQSSGEVAETIKDTFSSYSHCVVNRLDGSGGFGIVFGSLEEIGDILQNSLLQNQAIQVQGYLPVRISPCLIADITSEGEVKPLLVSEQVFSTPGAHAGNNWHEDMEEDLLHLASDFGRVNNAALQELANLGVVGQVNVDSMILSPEDAKKYQVNITTMREVNTRPAGSSVIIKLRKGNINGQKIIRIYTRTGIEIPYDVFTSSDFERTIRKCSGDGMKVVSYNYDVEHEKVALAFCGTSEISGKELKELESTVKETISQLGK